MLLNSLYQNKLVYRPFHTSPPRHIPPVLWIILKPVVKVGAWFTGRSTRTWYRQLPPEKRSIFVKHLNRNKYRYLGIIGTMGVAFGIHFYTHIETVPITGRKRYMILNEEKLKPFFEMNRDTVARRHHQKVLSEESIEFQFVTRVVRKIISSNMDIPNMSTMNWCVRIIDADTKNAFVLPSGDIYIYRGLLKRMKNEDQLAVILGHELAHAILGHSIEKLSSSQVTDLLAIVAAFIIWSIFPSDWTSFCVNYIFDKFVKLSVRLPHSRRLEEEADAVGLMLAAKACYDVRQSVDFWQAASETKKSTDNLDYTSTHPSNIKRLENFKEMIPWALDIRLQCKCDPFPQAQRVEVHEKV